MGGVVSSLLGGVTMGVTSSALNCICFACPWGASSVAKYLHLVLLLMALSVSYGWSKFADGVVSFPNFGSVENTNVEQARYFGPWAVVIGLCMYHGLQALLLVGVSSNTDKRSIVQNGGWPIKVFALIGCIVTAFFVPVEVYSVVFYAGVVASVLFLALQSVYLVDFAYRGAELLVEKYEESEGEIWKYSLFGITGLLYLVSLLMTLAIMYHHQELLLVAILNIVIVLVVSVCSILEEVQEANPQAGIFQAAFISFYNTFLLTVSSAHVDDLKSRIAGWEGTIHVFAAGLFIAGLGYYAATIGANPDTEPTEGHLEKGSITDDSSSGDQSLEYSMSLFHVYLILAVLYAAISITSWRQLEQSNLTGKQFKIGDVSLRTCKWAPLTASWLLTALYLWSLFAPLAFPDRDFT